MNNYTRFLNHLSRQKRILDKAIKKQRAEDTKEWEMGLRELDSMFKREKAIAREQGRLELQAEQSS